MGPRLREGDVVRSARQIGPAAADAASRLAQRARIHDHRAGRHHARRQIFRLALGAMGVEAILEGDLMQAHRPVILPLVALVMIVVGVIAVGIGLAAGVLLAIYFGRI